MNAMTKRALLLGVALHLVCCGGGQEQSTKDKLLSSVDKDVDVVGDLTGITDESQVEVPVDEAPTEEANAAEKAAEAELPGEPIAGPGGALVITVVISGEPTEAMCSVETATDRPDVVVQEIAPGTEIPLDPGKFDLHCKVTSLAGDPVVSMFNVEVPAGRRIKKEMPVRVGEITLVLAVGKGCRKQKIRIKTDGASEWFEEEFKTCVPIRLQAGEYEAEMGSGKHTTPITGIQVYEGSKRNMHVTSN